MGEKNEFGTNLTRLLGNMKEINIVFRKKEYRINDEKLYEVLKVLGYTGGMVWREEIRDKSLGSVKIRKKDKIKPKYKVNCEILMDILEEYKLNNKYFLENADKL